MKILLPSLPTLPETLRSIKNPPKTLFFRGNPQLLESKKIAIVGTRRPNPYTKTITQTLSRLISKNQGVVISGGALGVDIIAHSSAFPRTIMIAPTDLHHIYPATNKTIIEQIYKDALALSEYENNPRPKPYHFLERNRLVIALSDAVVIPQADVQSGSMQSAKIALELNKPLYVIPHRIGESDGTNSLLASNKVQAIYDPQDWITQWFGEQNNISNDEILEFCLKIPTFQEAHERFGDQLYEYELEGKIERKNGRIYVCYSSL